MPRWTTSGCTTRFAASGGCRDAGSSGAARGGARRAVRMTTVATARWEMGGEFHLPVEPPGPFHRWPDGAVWFALGRHAVQALLQQLGSLRLWLPDYFCHEVAQSWAEVAEVRVYE